MQWSVVTQCFTLSCRQDFYINIFIVIFCFVTLNEGSSMRCWCFDMKWFWYRRPKSSRCLSRCSVSLRVGRALAIRKDVKLGMFNPIVVEIFLFLQTMKFIHKFCDEDLMKMRRKAHHHRRIFKDLIKCVNTVSE